MLVLGIVRRDVLPRQIGQLYENHLISDYVRKSHFCLSACMIIIVDGILCQGMVFLF